MHRPCHELPILTKAMHCDQFDEIVTDRAVRRTTVAAHVHTLHDFNEAEEYLGRYIVAATSGTTGDPAFILYNAAEWATVLASFSTSRTICWLTGRDDPAPENGDCRFLDTLASLGADRHDLPSILPAHAAHRSRRTTRFDCPATERVAARSVGDLRLHGRDFGRRAGRGPAADRAGAGHQLGGGTDARTTPTCPRGVGRCALNQYGASEGGTFAVECESHTGLHIFEDLVLLEVVDADNRPVPPGTHGEKVLLTVLFNHTQPLIRYELSDSVRLSTSSAAHVAVPSDSLTIFKAAARKCFVFLLTVAGPWPSIP